MKLTKSVIHSLPLNDVEKLLSLGRYHRSAVLLGLNCDEFWNHMSRQKTKAEKQEIFDGFIQPYLSVWISCVYVVQEGFVKLSIEDEKLYNILSDKDMSTLKIFRHSTFHFNPRYKSKQHGDFYESKLTSVVARLHRRHGVLIRRFAKFIPTHPCIDENTLFQCL